MSDNKNDEIIKIIFKGRRVGYFRNSMEFPIKDCDKLIVETERGVDLGTAIINENETLYSVNNEEPRIVRKANDDDLAQDAANRREERRALEYCDKQAQKLGLEMHMVDVEYRLDRKKMIFYFTADGRVDFRELVKILARKYKTRIEMRQINPREELRRDNTIGPCGRTLCCQSFMGKFKPVKTELVKDQNIPMNPSKISGVCGKLKCCFRYEHERYKEFLKKYPDYGTTLKYQGENAKLEKIDIFQEMATLRFKNNGSRDKLKDITLKELKVIARKSDNN